jgi:hypothetical protein
MREVSADVAGHGTASKGSAGTGRRTGRLMERTSRRWRRRTARWRPGEELWRRQSRAGEQRGSGKDKRGKKHLRVHMYN